MHKPGLMNDLLVQVCLSKKYYALQVLPNNGLNSLASDHDGTFDVPEMLLRTTC